MPNRMTLQDPVSPPHGGNLFHTKGGPHGRDRSTGGLLLYRDAGQLDFVPANAPAFKAAARKAHWKVVGPKKCFLIYGEDRIGVVADLLAMLAEVKINVTASQAIVAGADRFGMILWVKPRDVKKAAKLLGAS
ncbi:MAG: hypothetical protein NTW68_13490 [candidate division NC10 bacterium]|nr:hypothetical protein [candidate division NC10 bacterium]